MASVASSTLPARCRLIQNVECKTIYVAMKYKVILLDLVSFSGLFGKTPSLEVADSITEMINLQASEGWELVAVVPVTDDGSPAQIRQAYHYFRKLA